MKRIAYHLFALSLLLSLGSCFYTSEPYYPSPEPWLCSVNADGTGFRRIKKVDMSFGTTGFWDIYMTKDDRIIFYGEKLWISETDTIRPVSITDNIYTLQQKPARLSQSPDGSKLYFASRDKNIHELDLNTMLSRQLTSESIRTLRNPIVSDLGNYITYSSRGYGEPSKATEYLYCMKLSTASSFMIPTADTVSANGMYIENTSTVYYERLGNGLWKSQLDGSDQSIIDVNNNGGSPTSLFSFSHNLRYVIRLTHYPVFAIRIVDLLDASAIEYPMQESMSGSPLAELIRNNNLVIYVPKNSQNRLLSYNMDTKEEQVLTDQIIGTDIHRIHMLAPTWDGSKVYFYAEISVH